MSGRCRPRRDGCVVVEQLNHSQWHVLYPHGRAGGVTGWCEAMACALAFAHLTNGSVESVDFAGDRLVMAEACHG